MRVFGILNVTPDSFSDGGLWFAESAAGGKVGAPATVDQAVARAWQIAEEGADVLDIGGESTRPGSREVSVEEELSRILPVLDGLGPDYPLPISVDTRRAPVLASACDRGAQFLNDTAALQDDPELAAVAAAHQCHVVLMHRQGTPESMQDSPRYDNLLREVREFLQERVAVAERAGIDPERLILDPGLGFGKARDHNYDLMAGLAELRWDSYPWLVGASRKSFLARFDDAPAAGRLPGSLAFVAAAWYAGVEWTRVHDVAETVKFLRTLRACAERGDRAAAREEIR